MATASAAAQPTQRWAREYETIYILRPDVDSAAQEKIVERAKEVIARLEGTLTKIDNWGRRKLAYPIQKNSRGIFVYLKYVGFSDLVAELERNLRLIDEVVRFQTVLVAEDIDPASVAVDPEEVQFLHVEEEEEDTEDAELERARSLGMAPRAPRDEGSDSEDQTDEGDDEGDDGGEESDSGSEEEAADDDTSGVDDAADADADAEDEDDR